MYLEMMDWEHNTKEHHMLARVALEIRGIAQMLSGSKKELTLDQFLPKFAIEKPVAMESVDDGMSDDERKQRATDAGKMIVASLFGFDPSQLGVSGGNTDGT